MQEIQLSNINNSKVLVRVGFDIPNFNSLDRIISAKETLKTLVESDNKIIILTKWGRPDGVFEENFSTKKLVSAVEGITGLPVKYINQFDEINIVETINNSYENIILLENIYFDDAETNPELVDNKAIFYSTLGDYFVDECFISSHRKDASNFYIKELLPFAYGINYQDEVLNLSKIKKNPERPFYVVIGGAKLKTKLPIIEKMLELSEGVLLCGLLCFTFISAKNQLSENKFNIYETKVEEDFIEKAKELLEKYPNKIHLPEDIVFESIKGKTVGVDIGPQTVDNFKSIIKTSKTIFWNGPAGFVEKKPFDIGSVEIANAIIENTSCYKVVGGGDTVGFLSSELKSKFDYISYAGGATLSFLSS